MDKHKEFKQSLQSDLEKKIQKNGRQKTKCEQLKIELDKTCDYLKKVETEQRNKYESALMKQREKYVKLKAEVKRYREQLIAYKELADKASLTDT